MHYVAPGYKGRYGARHTEMSVFFANNSVMITPATMKLYHHLECLHPNVWCTI